MDNQKKTPNRLINEASPYLLQHAQNPVDWYPWGVEAFDKAKKEDKPIFLSIGYSTCHWCHVMAHESFESEDVAEVLNSGFVSIKVDREQRPDIDEVYMNVCQAMTGSGGWPLSLFMTADKQPFFAGTYFPRESKYGMTGFVELCTNILRIWNLDRKSLLQNTEQLRSYFAEEAAQEPEDTDIKRVVEDGYAYLKRSYEKQYGGFSHSPKFPSPHKLLFLLYYHAAAGDKQAPEMTLHTLKSMYSGGMFDHVGGGFSRYSTDERWLVPHFEKMLYDNAMLLLAFSEAYAITKDNTYSRIINKICDYILRDMQSPKGGFFSAEDADSEGVEGKFYVFGYDELKQNFSDEDMRILEESFGVTKQGNFDGKNIINKIGLSLEETEEQKAVLKKLYDMRQNRIRPFKDTKISASWNGLMIEALCRAGVVTSNQSYIDSAIKAADFIINHMMYGEELYGIYKEGSNPTQAFLADYANFANALIALYSATLDLRYLRRAVRLAKQMVSRFFDENEKRFFMAGKNGEKLFFRPKDDYDGAMPSGNSSALMCLKSLYDLTQDTDIANVLSGAISSTLASAQSSPGAYLHFITLLQRGTAHHRQIVLSAQKENEEAEQAYRRIQKEFMPFTTLFYYDGTEETKETFSHLPDYGQESPFAAYICENFACQSPIYSAEELLKELNLSV